MSLISFVGFTVGIATRCSRVTMNVICSVSEYDDTSGGMQEFSRHEGKVAMIDEPLETEPAKPAGRHKRRWHQRN